MTEAAPRGECTDLMSKPTPNQTQREKKRPRRDAVINTTTAEDLEKEKIKEISYPIQADIRGIARITYNRKSVYLGPFDSPQSYITFGLWKRHLLETGKSAQASSLRPLVDAAMNAEPYRPPKPLNTAWFILAVFLGLTLIAAANYFGYQYYASVKPTEIDGVPMSEMELNGIRKVRKYAAPDERSPHLPPRPTAAMRSEAREFEKRNLATEGKSNAKENPPD
ncbi:MAG: hypothetical protein Aurels2KO_10740 [Aureliella sp.]